MENKINIARFKEGYGAAEVKGIWQWDYGQILRIQGLNLPTAVEIHFSLDEHGGEAVRRIGLTKDGVTDVPIPDSMVENESVYGDSYYFFAYIYLTDETSGNTEYKIRAKVSTRSKPEGFVSGGSDTFAEILKTVNEIASDKVDIPVPAKVGQVLAVKETDESGKPTEFEAKDMSGGVSEEEVKQAVEDYLIENPIEESDPTVPDWAKKPEKPSYTASEVGADTSGTAVAKVSEHNTASNAHNDIRLLVQGLTTRLNALADSDDTTLDQMSEVVAYIKSNKSLIDAITTSKINVSDIIDNLTTNVSNKPLSAAQGVALKAMIDAIATVELDESLTDNTKAAPAGVVGKLKSDLADVKFMSIPYKKGGDMDYYGNYKIGRILNSGVITGNGEFTDDTVIASCLVIEGIKSNCSLQVQESAGVKLARYDASGNLIGSVETLTGGAEYTGEIEIGDSSEMKIGVLLATWTWGSGVNLTKWKEIVKCFALTEVEVNVTIKDEGIEFSNLSSECVSRIKSLNPSGGSSTGNYCNVVDYGAKGDGLTDDTDAIQTALNVCRITGKPIYFPYNGGNCTFLTKKGLVMESNMSIKSARGAILMNGSAVLDNGGICAVTRTTEIASANSHSVVVSSTTGFVIGQEITIWEGIGKASYRETMADITAISGNTITFDTSRFTTNGTDDGLLYDMPSNSFVTNDFSLIKTVARNSEHISIEDITLMPCGNPALPCIYTISPISQTRQQWGFVQKDFRVSRVTVDGSVHDGISCQGESDIWIEDCIIKNISYKGIHFGTSCDRVNINGNYIYNCGTVKTESQADANDGGGGIYFCVNNHRVIIDGNQIEKCKKGVFGFDYRGNGQTDTDSIICNNTFDNCELSGIEVLGGHRAVINGNVFRNFDMDSIPIKCGSDSSGLLHSSIVNNVIGGFAETYTNANGAIHVNGASNCIVSNNNVQSDKINIKASNNCLICNNIASSVDSDSSNTNCMTVNNISV